MITKIVSETERSTTVQATTELTKVKFNDAWSYYAIRNDGSAEAYVSKRAFSNTTEDGVISIPAQGVASIPASVKSIYITGSGLVLVLGQHTPSLPFKAASKGGGSGGSYELPIATTEILGGVMPDGTTITVDENGVISAVTPSGQNYLIQYGTVSTKKEGRVSVYFPQSYKSVPKIFGYCELVGPSVVEWAAVHVRSGSYFEACSTWFTDGSISQRGAQVNWLAIGEV